MRYSSDLRKRVLDFIAAGGSKSEASRRFCVSRPTIDKWLKSSDPLSYEKPGSRGPTRLDPTALRSHVAAFPDQTLAKRADHFQVSTFCIWYGLKRINCTRKKNTGYKEQCLKQRCDYRQDLAAVQADGKSLVYVDESGFRSESFRRYAYAPRGECVLGLISSQRARTTTLLAARIENTFTATRLVQGGCKANDFNDYLDEVLCPRLSSDHVVIMDNARLHKTPRTRELIEATGTALMFLPSYSPDYNPVEHDFANIKRKREYHPEKSIENIIQMYK